MGLDSASHSPPWEQGLAEDEKEERDGSEWGYRLGERGGNE